MLSTLNFYIAPLLLQVVLTYFIAGLILVTRLADILRGGAPRSFYEQYSGTGGPPMVQRTTNQLANLFEFPTLFFAAIALAIAAGIRDATLLNLAWLFVASRWLHGAIHLWLNVLWVRMTVFMVSNLALIGLWIVLAMTALGVGRQA